MPNDSLQRMLEINSKIENNGNKPITQSKVTPNMHRITKKEDLDNIIEQYDKQLYGDQDNMILPKPDMKPYSAEEEMKRIQELEKNGGRKPINLENSKIPKNIIESIINDPLDVPPIVDPKMKMLEDRIVNKMSGIKNSVDLMKKIDKKEQEKKSIVTENNVINGGNSSIDYDMIRDIINEAIDNKLNSLNESTIGNRYSPSMKVMSFKDKFLFVDNDDNVFECIMQYKGKKKRKK